MILFFSHKTQEKNFAKIFPPLSRRGRFGRNIYIRIPAFCGPGRDNDVFSKKGPSQPAAAKPTSSGGADRRRTYHTVVNYLRGKDYKFDENADEFHIFFPTGLDTGHYTLLWKIEERYVTLVAMSPFSITGCSVDDVTLLCALANANLVNGNFYPTTDGEHIMVEVTQRVYSDREFGEKTAAYLLGVMGGNLDSRYMKSMESI